MARANRKAAQNVPLTGVERTFSENEFIVSKTDNRGVITYANDLFYKIADYTPKEILGAPHNIVRNPNMPRCVFKLLWEQIKEGKEIFAYVVNKTKFGDHYWVFAHVTPTFDASGNVTGFHSNRRVPKKSALDVIQPLYKTLLEEERKHGTPKAAADASYEMLMSIIKEKGVSYDEFILSI